MINKFLLPDIANDYDNYYKTEVGNQIDRIEKELINELIKDIPRVKMLELGAGTGHWSDFFIRQGFQVTGIDSSEAMLQVAKTKKLDAAFQLASAENIPFGNASFEVISSITMLEFVDDRERVVQEIGRVLKKDGWLILGCLNAKSVLGKTKENDEVFSKASFLTMEQLRALVKPIGNPIFKTGVFINTEFEILDGTEEINTAEPVFIGCVVQKK